MPIPERPQALQRQSAKSVVYQTVCDWIITGVMKPGEKILDSELASYFNVSRTPVREVLKILEQQKLIYTYPGRATIVADLALDDIESYYLPMQTLQCLAVRLAVNKATGADIAELEALNAQFGKAMDNSDAESILMADRNFHDKILEIAGNEYIDEFCSALWVRIARLDYMFFRDNTMGTSCNDHRLMIESFRIKDPFGAELAMKNNWNYSMLAVKAAVSQNGIGII